MRTHLKTFIVFLFSAFFAPLSFAEKAVNDDFAVDGTSSTDAQYFGSSGSNAIEVNPNSIGLVSGSSGRQIHALFETQTLSNAGDMLKASLTFTTPATVSAAGDDLRIGLFDHLERTSADSLGQDTSYSSSSPNTDFSGLPGFYLELDVEGSDPATDLDIRRSDPSTSGRLLSTSTGFTAFGSGPDIGYSFSPNTQYTVVFTLVRTARGELNITADFGDNSITSIDLTPESFNFGMLAIGASTDAFGSSSVAGEADNGIDIDKFAVELIPFLSSSSEGSKVVNDDFVANGTGTTDASYFGSSGSNAIEVNSNSIGLVSGSSGRQLHALFETQTLENAGDMLKAMVTFVTPDTVSSGSDDLRIGLFDHLERTGTDQLGQDTSYSSGSPNADFSGLPGFYLELDVESSDASSDLDIRRSDPSTSGRLLSTSSGFTAFGSGPDIGYAISTNTEYTVVFTLVRTAADALTITADFGDESFSVTDSTPASFSVGMLALGASTNAFGSSNVAGEADNGIDITKFAVEYTPFTTAEDESDKVVDDDFLNDGTMSTDADYFTSSSLSAIEFNDNSIGLVSGTSGRGIHALFDQQTLERAGDVIRAAITFTTPATVGIGNEDFRFGIFDHLERNISEQLAQNLTYSSSNPNALFNDLPGFYVELDVESASPISDLDIRKSRPTTSGRLLNTSNGFDSLGNGPDLGYTIDANTQYTLFVTVERKEDDSLDINANFLGRSFTVNDSSPLSYNFGMLAMHSSSEAFGSVNSPGQDDNGIDITNVSVEFIRGNPVVDNFSVDGTDSTDANYFGSSGSNAIEINDTSIGLVSGSSGRQIHALFDTLTLERAGDVIEASLTFLTPATVASSNEDLRIGLFDHLERTAADQLGQDTSFSSSSPNADFSGLPGFYLELDIESADAATEIDVRRSDPSETGRLLTTSSGFTAFGSGPDIGYVIEANTQYQVDFHLERNDSDGIDITTTFAGQSQTVTDATPESYNLGMLAFYASTGAVGSNSSVGADPALVNDNGIDLTSFSVSYIPFFDPEEIEIPPVVPPTGDHPDVEVIPTLPEGGGNDSEFDSPDINGSPEVQGSGVGNPEVVPAILSLVLLDDAPEPPVQSNALSIANYFSLNPNLPPWENFDLTDWALDAPNIDPSDGLSARTTDEDFGSGSLFPGSEPFFFTGSDGAMVFKSIVGGARTSQNTSFPRSELREMLRAGDTSISTQGVNANNWALDHQPVNPDIGARGGRLTATLSIDQVTSTGTSGQVGRVIIGQIHASSDEPLRLYYRKLPNNTKGSIYAAHEIRDGDDINIEIIGSRSNTAPDPIEDGIALGELFSYEINNVGADIEIIIRRGDNDGEIIGELTIDMDTIVDGGSGYDIIDEWMYFKAGAYTQNNTGWANDFDQVRFYRLENSH